MLNKKLLIRSFIHAVAAYAYICGIAAFFNLGIEKMFKNVPEFFAPIIILSLLVLSAAIMAILVFGKPVLLYVDNQKKEALSMLFYTLSCLAIIFVTTILILLTVY